MITRERVSLVVPIYNEEQNIPLLFEEIVVAMADVTPDYELILVDDRSTDGSFGQMLRLVRRDPRVTCIRLRRNQGQTAALSAGFDHASGTYIIAMDGDLQNDPADIPPLLRALQETGSDIASGWRRHRREPFFRRRLPSRIANWMISRLSGVKLHDYGATLKAYRRSLLNQVRLYGDHHRFIPALAARYGARVVEVPINDRRRRFGRSKYNLTRAFRVIIDLITIRFLLRYLTRPVHFFGIPGLLAFLTGGAIGVFLLLKKIILAVDVFTKHGPLMLLSVLLIIAGIQLICFGLLGELLTRIYFEGGNRTIYTIDRVYGQADMSDEDLAIGSAPAPEVSPPDA
ncbi:MAG: glycosyltransferase family 2 protein [Acidobacteria bacterium]|nr:glycosyltransferase family 2 protein [Acidobacteriota bacterium]